ncbi:MAG: Hint domain-containing protein, partial [Acetobacteraceae bacterium]
THAVDPSSGTTEKYLELDGVCFAAGTRIAVETGERAVEDLRPGDLVATVSTGQRTLQPVRWIGERSIELTLHPRPESLYPIRIRRGAFADELPQRDLLVSPNHCLFVDEQLVPAKLLVNGTTIVQDRSVRAIHYHHVELECHDVLLAEGLPAESYLDTENRAFFANADGPTILHPNLDPDPGLAAWQDRLCAPLRLRSVEVDLIWHRLASRGERLGYVAPAVATTTDPDLRLLVGERLLWPMAQDHNRCIFVAPSGSSDVRILSRSVVPVELSHHADDWRRLGVAVKKIVLRRGNEQIDIPPDHPTLAQGWHLAEADEATAWRWTTGDGLLPLPPAWRAGALTIEVYLGHGIAYPIDDQALVRQVA